jgi:ubiquinone/menaquinone biosynthesis C-methylase UbiE
MVVTKGLLRMSETIRDQNGHNEKLRVVSGQGKFTIYNAWQRFGITKHWGTVSATQRLIKLCNIIAGQYVLDVGCGTGYTACLLAKDYDVNVVAADLNSKVLEKANKRIAEEKVSGKVKTVKADAHGLPFSPNAFDAVIAESVLAFCDKRRVSSEVYRVLKLGGVFGNNEGTWLKSPPAQLSSFLSKAYSIDIELLQEDEWRAVYEEAGFEVISSTIYPFNYIEQFFGEIRVDGIRRRLSAWLKAFSDPTVRRTIFKMDKETRKGLRQFLSYAGYGLYVSRKPEIFVRNT